MLLAIIPLLLFFEQRCEGKEVRERHVDIFRKCILNIEKKQGLNCLENSLDSSMASVEFRQRKDNRSGGLIVLGQ